MHCWTDADLPDLTGKRALITGATRGIGYATARALALHGAEVIMASRNAVDGEQAVERIRSQRSGARVEFRRLDLGSLQEVREFCATLLAEGRGLDLLINNSGLNPLNVRHLSRDGFELSFGVGHLGHFALTGQLLPLLLKTPVPRVVTVSSIVQQYGFFDWDDLQIQHNYSSQRAYNQTKLANLMFARELQRRASAAHLPLLSIGVHPGMARTNIADARHELGEFQFADYLISVAMMLMFFVGQSAREGAWPLLYAATDPAAQGGGYYGPHGIAETRGFPAPARLHTAVLAEATAQRLWQISEQLTGIHFALPDA